MPGIFADPEATFPITVHYREIVDDAGNEIDVDVWTQGGEPNDGGWKSFTAHFGQIDEDSFSKIMEDATIINHVTGNPILRTKSLREQVIATYMRSWDIGEDGEGSHSPDESVPITKDAILRSRFKIANHLFVLFMKKSKMEGVVKAAMQEEQRIANLNGGRGFLGGATMGPSQQPSQSHQGPPLSPPSQQPIIAPPAKQQGNSSSPGMMHQPPNDQ